MKNERPDDQLYYEQNFPLEDGFGVGKSTGTYSSIRADVSMRNGDFLASAIQICNDLTAGA